MTRARQRGSTSVGVSRPLRDDLDLSALPTGGIRLRDIPDLDPEEEYVSSAPTGMG